MYSGTVEERKSRRNCCVVGCGNTEAKTSKEIKFYAFPNRPWEQDKRQKWINAVNRKNHDGSDWSPTQYSVICCTHFVGNSKSGHPLNPSFIPTIFPAVYKLRMEKIVDINANCSRNGVDGKAQDILSRKVNSEVAIIDQLRGVYLITESSSSTALDLSRRTTQARQQQCDGVTESESAFRFVDVDVNRVQPNFERCPPSSVDPLELSTHEATDHTDMLENNPAKRKEEPREPEESLPTEVSEPSEPVYAEQELFPFTEGNESHFNCVTIPVHIKCEEEEKDCEEATNVMSDNSSEDYNNYSSISSEANPHCCEICEARFHQKDQLTRHINRTHIDKPYSCVACPSRFPRKESLTRHMKSHTGDKPYSCNICQAKLSQRVNLTIHMRTHTGEKPYSCDICPARFSNKWNLTTHVRTHTGEKPYLCEICKARFSQSGDLTTHMRTHTGEKPFSCDICPATFSHKWALTTHIRKHTGDKAYSCDKCSARFSQRAHLTVHERKHTGERPFSCDICHATFPHKRHVTTHMRTHTGERPYSCDLCEAKFTQRGHLTVHIRRHMGEKPYSCEICPSKFAEKGNLTTHMRTHRRKGLLR